MKKNLCLPVLFCLALLSCSDNGSHSDGASTPGTQTGDSAPPAEAMQQDSITPPPGYAALASATGDLDKDGQAEQAVVYGTDRETDGGKERELQIFKRTPNNGWELWHKSVGPVMGSEQGGVMGDPFESVAIEQGCVALAHFGGSREKWHYTHRFRYQDNDWKLIGATVNQGAPCDYFEDFDFNLSTGQINYKKTTEDCEKSQDNPITKVTEKSYTVKLQVLPSMDGFQPGANMVKLPKSDIEFYY